MAGEETGYRYCPSCGAEYDEGVKFCADCSIELVSLSELRGMKATPEEKPTEATVHIGGDGDEAREMTRQLTETAIDARVEEIDTEEAGLTFSSHKIYHVVVPAEHEERARFLLQQWYPEIYGWAYAEDAAEADEEALKRLNAAIEAEEEGLPALVEFFGETPGLRGRAMAAAAEFDEGLELLLEWVKKTCREKHLEPLESSAVAEASRLLGLEEPQWAAGELARELVNPDWWARKNFCYALGKLQNDAVIPLLVLELKDPDSRVRSEAMDFLYTLMHTDYGYDPDREPEEQPEALVKWEGFAARYK
jgi:hypothetical protein